MTLSQIRVSVGLPIGHHGRLGCTDPEASSRQTVSLLLISGPPVLAIFVYTIPSGSSATRQERAPQSARHCPGASATPLAPCPGQSVSRGCEPGAPTMPNSQSGIDRSTLQGNMIAFSDRFACLVRLYPGARFCSYSVSLAPPFVCQSDTTGVLQIRANLTPNRGTGLGGAGNRRRSVRLLPAK